MKQIIISFMHRKHRYDGSSFREVRGQTCGISHFGADCNQLKLLYDDQHEYLKNANSPLRVSRVFVLSWLLHKTWRPALLRLPAPHVDTHGQKFLPSGLALKNLR